VSSKINALEKALSQLDGAVVFVSNEVGLGIVPENATARAFRDHAGWLHQRLAACADRVVFMVAGLPSIIKDPTLEKQ
jgi:adenosylcobinamide kinase/adenosylcobinamide-phosphate guanylyltransferase